MLLYPFTDFQRCLKVLPPSLRKRTGGLLCLMVIQGLLELTFILALSWMTVALTNSQELRQKLLFSTLFDYSPWLSEACLDPRNLLLLTGTLVVFASLIKSLVSWQVAKKNVGLSDDISMNIGQSIMCHYLYSNYTWHLSKESETVYNKLRSRLQLSNFLINTLSMYASCITMLLLFMSFIGQEPILSTFIITFTLLFGIILYRNLREKVESNGLVLSRSSSSENKAILCATKGIRDVLLFQQQNTFLKAVLTTAKESKTARTFNAIAPTMPTWVLEFVGFVAMLIAISYLSFYEHADLPRIRSALALLILTAWRVLPYCNRIVGYQVRIRSLRQPALSVLELLEVIHPHPVHKQETPDPNFKFTNKIELRNVTFRYPESAQDALQHINLVIRKGQKVGLIGPSGAGKSTLAGVLAMLLHPTEGSYLIDGQIPTPAKTSAFMKQIGYVPQNSFLFQGTVAENIAFSQWGQPWDEKRVLSAARKAAIDFISNDRKGLYKKVGEYGAGLSGGQAQRLSIARALYNNPTILFFDEATSALDQNNENIIMETIRNIPDTVTIFIIAHRLSTVEQCDSIIWMEGGRIRQIGTPNDVLPAYKQVTAKI